MSTSYLIVPSLGSPTTTTIGQRVPHKDRLNRIATGGFVVIGILFVVFLYFYISLLFQERPIELNSKESRARTAASSDTEAGADMDPAERSTLLAWMHRRSRGRFVDITGTVHQNPQIPLPPKLEARSNGKRANSFFSRISSVPHLVFPSLPPPVYSIPPVPARIVSESESDTSSKTSIKRTFFPAYRLSLRSKPVLFDLEEVTSTSKALLNRVSMVSLGYPVDNMTKTSCCISDSSLHPSCIHPPLKAVLVDKAGSLLGIEGTPMTKTKPRTIQQQGFSRARVAGESDPF